MSPLEYGNRDRRRDPAATATPVAALWPLLRALRSHRLVAFAIVALTVLSSLAWLTQRAPQYSASAEVLVTPLSATDRSFAGLPLLRAVGPDASSGVGSAVVLLDSPEAASLAAKRIGKGQTQTSIERAVEIERSEDAGVVVVTAESDDAELAAEIVNEFVEASLDIRATELGAIADQQIERSQELLDEAGSSSDVATENLRTRIADLEQIRDSGDPTLTVAREAPVPSSADGAPRPAIMLVSLVAGLALACMTVVLLDVLGPSRIFDEAALLEVLELPVLVRLPGFARGRSHGAVSQSRAKMRDAQRSLRSQLEIQVPGRPRSSNGAGPRTTRAVAITSPSRGDGSTIVATGLAHAILDAEASCSVVDLDLATRGAERAFGLVDEPRETVPVGHGGGGATFARTSVRQHSGLELLTVAGSDASIDASLSHGDDLIELGRSSSDWIVVDTPPVAGAAGTLPAMKAVDAVLIVVKLRSTARSDLFRLREILELVDIEPLGYVVIGPDEVGSRRSRPPARRRWRA